MITTDRVSAFDHILGTIPFKGEVLTQIAKFWFEKTKDIVPNHILSYPDPQALIVKEAKPLPVEVIIRDNQYKFFTLENRAWLADGQNGKKLIKDMKNGARIHVKSVSNRGTKITDTYSLIGFTKALAAIDKACS